MILKPAVLALADNPSAEAWQALCARVHAWPKEGLIEKCSALAARTAHWPDALRTLWRPWAERCQADDPRLMIVRHVQPAMFMDAVGFRAFFDSPYNRITDPFYWTQAFLHGLTDLGHGGVYRLERVRGGVSEVAVAAVYGCPAASVEFEVLRRRGDRRSLAPAWRGEVRRLLSSVGGSIEPAQYGPWIDELVELGFGELLQLEQSGFDLVQVHHKVMPDPAAWGETFESHVLANRNGTFLVNLE